MVGTQTFSVLHGTSPVLWASSGGTLVGWQQRATVTDRRIGVIIVSGNIKILLYQSINTRMRSKSTGA